MKITHEFGKRAYAPVKWDRYNAFYTENGIFAEFQTGEVVITDSLPNPYERHVYSDYNVQVVSTTSSNCPELFLDAECTEPVKKAWVNSEGQQILAIDLDHKVAVNLASTWQNAAATPARRMLGGNFARQAAYWANADQPPTPLSYVEISRPDPEFRKKMKPVIDDATAALTAMWRLRGEEYKTWWYDGAMKLPYNSSLTVENIVEMYGKDERALFSVATSGISMPRKVENVYQLYIK